MNTLFVLLISTLSLVSAKSISTGEHFVEAIEDFVEEVAEIESKCYFYQYQTEQAECESYYGVDIGITIVNLLIGAAIVSIFMFCCKKLFNCCKCCKKEPYIHPIK